MKNYFILRNFELYWNSKEGHTGKHLTIEHKNDTVPKRQYLSCLEEQYNHMTTCGSCSSPASEETVVIHGWFLYAVA